MDRADLPEPRRAALVASLDAWNLRFGNYVRFTTLVRPALRDGDTVLDVASGHGGFARALRAAAPGCRVVAADVAPVRADDGLAWWAFDGRRLAAEVPVGAVDVITCTSALHHFGAGGVAVLLAQALARARAVALIDVARSLDGLVAGAAIATLAGADPALTHDVALSFRRAFRPAELRLVARLVPGGERVAVALVAPGFVVVRAG
jgi:2-polyprenyl-3-methyl-5-hydroxy-6-metoxy-1,4-benzoquinol methylase